jgi:RNA polymerase sigma-70 factor, ECF subfamily
MQRVSQESDTEPTETESRERRRERTGIPADPHTAFERLLWPAREALLTHARRLTRDPWEAEDLVQETLTRAYIRLDTLTDAATARAWLHAILRNLFINEYRRRDRSPRSFSLEEQGGSGTVSASAATQPERITERRLQRRAALNALAALPEPFRIPVYLADVEELNYDEIGVRLSLPPGTVRSRIARGRARLLRSLYAWQDAPLA